MTEFHDSDGRQWQVNVTVGTVKACRELLDVDLCDLPVDMKLLQRLRTDDVLLCNVLYVCCRRQCEELGVSDEAFGELLGGDVIETAEDAFWEGVLRFFRGERRGILTEALAAMKREDEARLEVLQSELTPDMQRKFIERGKAILRKGLAESLNAETSGNGALS